jgi:ADP-heptose:LPS heptosyltransferase
VLQAVPEERRVDLVGRADLPTLYACLQRASLFVGNDSGLMHMAAAAGIPTLGLFGPSRDELYGPWGPRCAAVRTPESYDELIGAPGFDVHTTGSLMLGLEVESVERAVRHLLDRVGV